MPLKTSLPEPILKLGLFQFEPRLRDVAGNSARIVTAAADAQADLLVTPELSLTGYDLRDDVHTIAALPAELAQTFDSPVLAGLVERSDSAIPYNAAALFQRGDVSFLHRKIYLPTYGMFDEGRYFGQGRRIETFVINGWRIGVLICEDMWHPMLAYLLAMHGVHVIVVMAAAPGRGAWEGGEDGGFFASSDAWQRIARSFAQLYGVYVAVCNRIGVEGAVTFAGESFLVAPDTNVIARAGIDEELLTVELRADLLRQTRTPYAHLRDEDVALFMSELARLR